MDILVRTLYWLAWWFAASAAATLMYVLWRVLLDRAEKWHAWRRLQAIRRELNEEQREADLAALRARVRTPGDVVTFRKVH